MRYVCLLALILPVLPAQDGAAIYQTHPSVDAGCSKTVPVHPRR